MSKSNKKVLITFSIILVVLLLAVFLYNYTSKVPSNDPSYIGNTASNLYNGGTFCEHDGKVFFANGYDSDSLYIMNSDESHVKKLNSVAVASINADDHRAYYSQTGKSSGKGLGYVRKTTGLFSCNYKGNKAICYTQNPVGVAILCGDNLIYQNFVKKVGTTIYSITTNKENNHEIIDQMISPACSYNGSIFYGNLSRDHYLYIYDIVTNATEIYLEKEVYNPVYFSDGCIYYIDPTTDYELHKYAPYDGSDVTLSTERVDLFNINGNYVYYQVSVGDSPALHRVNTDGTNDIVIADGIFKDLQTTSKYVYFRPFNSEDNPVMYHVPHDSTNVSVFDPGVKK